MLLNLLMDNDLSSLIEKNHQLTDECNNKKLLLNSCKDLKYNLELILELKQKQQQELKKLEELKQKKEFEIELETKKKIKKKLKKEQHK